VFTIDAFTILIFIVVPDVVAKLSVDTLIVDEFVVPLFAISELEVDAFDVDELEVDELLVDELLVDELLVDELLVDEFAFDTFNVVNVIEGRLILLTFKLLTLRTDVELPILIIVVVLVYKLTTFGGDFDCIASITSSFAVITPPSISPPWPSSTEIMEFIDLVIYALFVCVDIYIYIYDLLIYIRFSNFSLILSKIINFL
jgi:hypothetical protein